jgi:hypothetical protein
MDSEISKTRAEILNELSSVGKRPSRDQDLAALLKLLNIPLDKSDIQKVIRRAEREYFLICSRATARQARAKTSEEPEACGDRMTSLPEAEAAGTSEILPGSARVEEILARLDQAGDGDSPEGVLMRIVVEAGKLMGAETAILALLDKDGGTYTCHAAAGPSALDCLGMTVPVAETSVCGWVIRQNIHFTTADAATDMRCGPFFRRIVKAGGVAAAPLIDSNAVIGVVAVANRRGGATFTKRETREVLLPFVESAARLLSAIGQVRLHGGKR